MSNTSFDSLSLSPGQTPAQRNLFLRQVGEHLREVLPGGFGKIEFNYASGQYRGATITETVRNTTD
jgi:hypothetical protein